MIFTTAISKSTPLRIEAEQSKEKIQLEIFSEPDSPENITKQLAAMGEAMEVYCWYEGSQYLPKTGALFMKRQFFDPLYRLNPKAKLCLYSLRAWNFKKNVGEIKATTPLGEAINRINTQAVECIYSSSFFEYCRQISKSELSTFLSQELPKKEWLFQLSKNSRKKNMTMNDFFNHQSSLFDCIKDLDVSSAYSAMQYIEGFYLIQESVRKGILKNQQKILISFILPNDESKYYLDLPKDIEKMLHLEFKEKLIDLEIRIFFYFFKYGESTASRPYIGKTPKVDPEDIQFYFDYLTPSNSLKMPPLRDVIHHLNL